MFSRAGLGARPAANAARAAGVSSAQSRSWVHHNMGGRAGPRARRVRAATPPSSRPGLGSRLASAPELLGHRGRSPLTQTSLRMSVFGCAMGAIASQSKTGTATPRVVDDRGNTASRPRVIDDLGLCQPARGHEANECWVAPGSARHRWPVPPCGIGVSARVHGWCRTPPSAWPAAQSHDGARTPPPVLSRPICKKPAVTSTLEVST